jgi:formiminotetrahydrofolate cyclodeaminase
MTSMLMSTEGLWGSSRVTSTRSVEGRIHTGDTIMSEQSGIREYLDALASGESTPGGGSATGLAGALGAALGSMVANFTIGKEKYADVEAEMQQALQRSEELRAELTELMDADAEAYGKVTEAYKLPKDTDEQSAARTAAIQEALKGAAEVPLTVARCCFEVLKLSVPLAENGNTYLVTDAGVAARLADAALHSAWLNVEINLRSIKDEAFCEEKRQTLGDMTTEGKALLAAAWDATLSRM